MASVTGKRGRPCLMTLEKTQALVQLHQTTGRTYKALCLERHIKYVTLNTALKRFGLTDKALKAQAASVQQVA